MGGVGSTADNALAESFNAALKREVLQDRACWPDAATCRREVFRWLARYNTKRSHSRCRHSSFATYERTLTPTTQLQEVTGQKITIRDGEAVIVESDAA
jgi:transposase InsO family protein